MNQQEPLTNIMPEIENAFPLLEHKWHTISIQKKIYILYSTYCNPFKIVFSSLHWEKKKKKSKGRQNKTNKQTNENKAKDKTIKWWSKQHKYLQSQLIQKIYIYMYMIHLFQLIYLLRGRSCDFLYELGLCLMCLISLAGRWN